MAYAVRASRRSFDGRVIAVRSDDVEMPDGAVSTRDVVEHPGAVAVVALDDLGRIALVRQYRHPVTESLWELPAGLLDFPDEPAVVAAARELQEETGWAGSSWYVLADVLTSPGMTDEAIRIFLARDLREGERPPGIHEEAEMELRWVALEEATARVFAGDIRNGAACVGILAARWAGESDFAGLRAVTAPWPDRPGRVPLPDS